LKNISRFSLAKEKKTMKIERGITRKHHTLFVEGQNESANDPTFLKHLFDGEPVIPDVKPMKTSSSIKSVAESLFVYNPTYYFLVDRDHHVDEFVENSWKNFPDNKTSNLLIWRKKEMENDFLDPVYISQSQYCVAKDKIAQKVLDFANERFFMDVVNRVIIEVRERFKENWIRTFDQLSQFSSKNVALTKLLSMREFEEFHSKVENGISQKELVSLFNSFSNEMSGGKEKLEFGSGNWIDRMSGKRVLTQLINSDCFDVRDSSGADVRGREKFQEVIKDLLKNVKKQPDDFIELKRMILERISGIR
jgi:hypothetical protein